jgi:hypothetical protein
MESNTLIAGLIALAICLLPFVLVSRNRKIKEKQLMQALQTIASQNHGQVDEYDTWGNTAIGFDRQANAVVFCKHIKNEIISHYISLADVQECQVMNTHKVLQEKESTYEVTYKLELVFTLEDPSKPLITLEFYNKDHDSPTPSGEIEMVEKWFKIVQKSVEAV